MIHGHLSRDMASVDPETCILAQLPMMMVVPVAGAHTRSPSGFPQPVGQPSQPLPQILERTPEIMNRKIKE